MRWKFAPATLLIAVLLNGKSEGYTFHTVALVGQQGPGTPAGDVFSNFNGGVINADGTVVFNGLLNGPGVISNGASTSEGLWRESGGVLTKVVRAGDQAVGLPAGTNYYFPSLGAIDAQGRVAFSAEAPGVSAQGIFSEGQGSLRLVGHQPDQVPGQPAGVTFYQVSSVPLINASGQIAFTSFIRGPGLPDFTDALFTDRSGPLELLIRDGSPAPGIAGSTISGLSPPAFNGNGSVAFTGQFSGGTYPNDYGIWSDVGGSMALIARAGDTPTGLPAGVAIGQIGVKPDLNNAGKIVFSSTLIGAGVTSSNDAALWSSIGGSTQLIARKGDAAPGLPAGTSYGNFDRLYLNKAGNTTVVGSLIGAGVTAQNDKAIWSQRGGSLSLVAREGDAAPGTGPGIVFGDFEGLAIGFQVNGLGQVAFQGSLVGPGVTSANDQGIWVTDLSGTLRLIAREGDLFDANDDPNVTDLRTVGSMRLPIGGGGEDGSGSSFNNSGQLVISMLFSDFSGGVFVINTVPEPSCAFLLLISSLTMILRRRGSWVTAS